MENPNQSIFQKTYLTVSPACAAYFKKVWLEKTGLTERQLRNRLINPSLDDVLLFCKVCNCDLAETLKPFSEKFKNVPPYQKSLQLTID